MSSEMLTLLTTFSCERKHTIKHRARADPTPETKSNRGILAGRKKKKKQVLFQEEVSKYRVSKTVRGGYEFKGGREKGGHRGTKSFLDTKT